MQNIFFLSLLLLISCFSLYGENGNYFVAIDIPQEIEDTVDSCKEILAKQLFGTFEPREKYHITLKYLGELNQEQLLSAQTILENKLKNQQEFSIWVKELGFFPGIKKARVAWVGAHSIELYKLQSMIENSLSQFSRTEKFQAHITIARLSYPPPVWLLEKFQKKIEEKALSTQFTAKEILLFKSIQGKYEKIASFPLSKQE